MLFAKKFRGIFFDVVELTLTTNKVKIFENCQFYFMDFCSLHPLKGPQGPLTNLKNFLATHGTNYISSAATSPDPPPKGMGTNIWQGSW